jgi:hypothetical protein
MWVLTMVIISMVMLELVVLAGFRAKGPGCGGTLLDGGEQSGDTILVLYSGGGWNSGGPVIAQNLNVEGGWRLKSGETCSSAQTYTDTSKFEFIGPLTRSTATEFNVPIMEIDPSVLTLTVKHLILKQQGFVTKGGGITGVISNGAYVLLENLSFEDSSGGTDDGAGLYLEVRGNSRLIISGTQFLTNTAQNTGGGFEIVVFDGSQVILNNVEVRGNRALNGNGGGGRILIDRGSVTVAGSSFSNNLANQGKGGGLAVEATGSGPAYLILQGNVFSGNNATITDDDLHISGDVKVLDKLTFLPLIRKNS